MHRLDGSVTDLDELIDAHDEYTASLQERGLTAQILYAGDPESMRSSDQSLFVSRMNSIFKLVQQYVAAQVSFLLNI